MSEWKPIKTAPKHQRILIATDAFEGGIVIARWFKYNGLSAFRDEDADPHFPKYWLPLPKLPKDF